MYKIAILYAGEEYSRYVNLIKYEQAKGNIEVIGIGAELYMNFLDGWKMYTLGDALTLEWDYLVISATGNRFYEMKHMLMTLGISEAKIVPINIFAIPGFDFIEYTQLNESKVSIIASHCWGGFTYHALGMEFLSPTVNLFIKENDYIRMVENLEYYFSNKVDFCREEYETNLKRNYPVGKIGDIEIHFNHYVSIEDAVNKWEENRINWDNLFLEMYTNNMEMAERFDRLPYSNKVVFVPFECRLKSAMNIGKLAQGMKQNQGLELYEVVNRLASSQLSYYNPVKLLRGAEDFLR